MDFFTAHHGQPTAAVTPSVDPFAQEIGRRFSLPAGQPLLTARLSPVATVVAAVSSPGPRLGNLSLRSKPPSPTPVSPPLASTSSDSRVITIIPTTLAPILCAEGLLVLDIRPHGTFTQSRLPHALSLSVPSTLLKRPAFSLDKLAEMLPSAAGRRHFASWKTASRILVYDADSQAIPDGSNIRGLLRKFENEGFRGDLLWLKGGFGGVWRECRTLVDDGPPSPESSEEDESAGGYLRARKLPLSAFQQVSTTTASQRPPVRPVPVLAQHQVAPAPTLTRTLPANPFYDNIRQNRELEHGITERIPLRLPPAVVARRDDLPFDWLKEIVDKADAEEGTEALAMQFYMIELREQRRLMGVMDHHSREAGAARGAAFPYSITAGVEKGSKNRYTNIWPFEHARVRLNTELDDGSDYINASHVQPLGTDRRYIATQGPLPTTYTDFWTLCWEQHISIIVMLTKEVEGSTVKCGSYWTDAKYGPLRLQLVSSDSATEHEPAPAPTGFDFGLPPGGQPLDPDKAIVRRSFLLSHTSHPELPARKITQLQYLAWPDFDVPEDPRGLLGLMREVDVLRAEAEEQGPVLLHCSAGIGRTGGFIVADAALDGIRREMRKRRANPRRERDLVFPESPAPMDVDSSDPGASPRQDLHTFSPMRDISPIRRTSPVHMHRPRPYPMRAPHHDGNGTDTDDSVQRSLSPGPAPAGTSPSSSSGSVLRPSVFAADTDTRRLSTRARTSRPSLFADTEPASAVGRFRAGLSASATPSTSTGTTGLFSASLDKSTAASSFPVSVESSRSPSPSKDAEPHQALVTAFDYTDPRRLHAAGTPDLLSSFTEPVRKMLEDMREQRMSLCQSLRQYVFVHRAIVEGALEIVDEERAAAQSRGKRGPSPTALTIEDRTGAVRLSKRPSMKRRLRSDSSIDGAGGTAAR